MSYNTWPTFAGRGWNIKKRPITRTIIETADGGQEFRLARFQNPLYEFDVEIPYLSQADYATLQNFFAQQSGSLAPFLIAPDNDSSVSAQKFFTGDGVATKATLVMPDGSPALFANSGTTPTVTAIHQTDWQGRLALSNQARTNLAQQSDNPLLWAATAVTLTSSSTVAPNGKTAALAVPTTANATHLMRPASVSPSLTAGQPVAFTVVAKYAGYGLVVQITQSSGGVNGIAAVDLSSGAVSVTSQPVYPFTVITTPLANGWWRIEARSQTVATGTAPVVAIYPSPSNLTIFTGDGTSGVLLSVSDVDQAAAVGVHIPTTTAPVTVTDYTQAGNQITFGQMPAKGAIEDWDGTYAYLVRFKDDQIEMTQTMSQIYEATTVTLRSVR